MKIDFVSDVACPWCAVGLFSLEEALRRIGPHLQVELRFQPFELNPRMPPEGEDTVEHLARKYGASPERLAATRETLRQRGAELGFTFGDRPRIWNTFDAHRLLHWAGRDGPEGKQRELKHALLAAYHTHAQGNMTAFDRAFAMSKGNTANVDLGHFVAAGGDPVAFITRFNGRISSVHLKDRTTPANGQQNLPWGTGNTPLKEILLTMKRERHTYPASIELEYEVPAGSDAVKETVKCLDFCKAALANT